MKFLSPYTVMLTINLEPIYGIILAVIVFHDKEKMSIEFYIGALIILATVILNGIIKTIKSSIKNQLTNYLFLYMKIDKFSKMFTTKIKFFLLFIILYFIFAFQTK